MLRIWQSCVRIDKHIIVISLGASMCLSEVANMGAVQSERKVCQNAFGKDEVNVDCGPLEISVNL